MSMSIKQANYIIMETREGALGLDIIDDYYLK